MAKLICDSCCFCVNLRTACFFIGYLQLLNQIGTAGKLFLYSFGITERDSHMKRLEEDTDIPLNDLIAIIMIALAISFSFTVILLFGLYKSKRRLVAVNLCYMATLIILGIIGFVVVMVYGLYAYSIIFVIVTASSVCFLMVIRSYYYKMDDIDIIASERGVGYNAASLARV